MISQLNHNKSLLVYNKKVEPKLIDIFHDNLVLQRNIGHSELVFNHVGGFTKDFSKNWNLDERIEKSTNFECFVCQKHRYVQVFYRRQTRNQDFEVVKDSKIIQMIE